MMNRWLGGVLMGVAAVVLCSAAGETLAEPGETLDQWTEQYLTAQGSGIWITGLEHEDAQGNSLGIFNTMSEDVRLGGRPLTLPVQPYDVIVSERQMRLRVQYIDQDGDLQSYDTLLGPYESQAPKVIGHFKPPESASPIYVTRGWAYLSGTCPMGETSRATTSGQGTEMIIQVVKTETEDVQRVFLVGNATAEVEVVSKVVPSNDPDYKKTLTTVDTYVEIGTNGKIGDPQTLNIAPAEVQQFVTYVKNQATAAGL